MLGLEIVRDLDFSDDKDFKLKCCVKCESGEE